jgi:hypothetical protein
LSFGEIILTATLEMSLEEIQELDRIITMHRDAVGTNPIIDDLAKEVRAQILRLGKLAAFNLALEESGEEELEITEARQLEAPEEEEVDDEEEPEELEL